MKTTTNIKHLDDMQLIMKSLIWLIENVVVTHSKNWKIHEELIHRSNELRHNIPMKEYVRAVEAGEIKGSDNDMEDKHGSQV